VKRKLHCATVLQTAGERCAFCVHSVHISG
jgi:hypothetical protein